VTMERCLACEAVVSKEIMSIAAGDVPRSIAQIQDRTSVSGCSPFVDGLLSISYLAQDRARKSKGLSRR
jgi:hypothetical protein